MFTIHTRNGEVLHEIAEATTALEAIGILSDGGVKRALLPMSDLRGADLRGANLQGADLREADLRGANLQGADLREADISADFSYASLGNAKMELCIARYASFNFAELAEVDASFVSFSSCKFVGANLRGAQLGSAKLLRSDFTSADLHGADLIGSDVSQSVFVGASLRRVRFSKAIISAATFDGAVFEGADFSGAQLVDYGETHGYPFSFGPINGQPITVYNSQSGLILLTQDFYGPLVEFEAREETGFYGSAFAFVRQHFASEA